MKYTMLMTAVLAAAYALPYSTEEPIDKRLLTKELQEFQRLVPYVDISELFTVYTVEDKEVKNFIEYVYTDEFKSLFEALQDTPEALELFEYLDWAGLDIYSELNWINYVLGIGKAKRSVSHMNLQITGGLSGLAEDIRTMIPFDRIDELHEKKMKTSEIYAAFIARLTSPELDGHLLAVEQNNIYGQIIDSAQRAGIDVVAVKQIVCMLDILKEC